MVLVIAANHPLEPLPNVLHLLVYALAQRLPNLLQLGRHSLADRLPVHLKVPRRAAVPRHSARTQSDASSPDVAPARTSARAPATPSGTSRHLPGTETPAHRRPRNAPRSPRRAPPSSAMLPPTDRAHSAEIGRASCRERV